MATVTLSSPVSLFREEVLKVGDGPGTKNGVCVEAPSWLEERKDKTLQDVLAEAPHDWLMWTLWHVTTLSDEVRKKSLEFMSLTPKMAFLLSEQFPQLEETLEPFYENTRYANERKSQREVA